jgi:hypothetical protein
MAVATTSRRHGSQCWKSETGWSARLGRSMDPTVSGSNRRLDWISKRNSGVVMVVFPQPTVPFSQTITWSCYERPQSHSSDGRRRRAPLDPGSWMREAVISVRRDPRRARR